MKDIDLLSVAEIEAQIAAIKDSLIAEAEAEVAQMQEEAFAPIKKDIEEMKKILGR